VLFHTFLLVQNNQLSLKTALHSLGSIELTYRNN
jgi:hypothetical protein